jgi:hypothetical protein
MAVAVPMILFLKIGTAFTKHGVVQGLALIHF